MTALHQGFVSFPEAFARWRDVGAEFSLSKTLSIDQTAMVRAASPSGKPSWPFLLGLAALVGAVFWPVLSFAFVRWDDDINITQNPLLTQPWSWSLVGQLFSGEQAMRFKPLHWLFDRGLHRLFGFDPRGWHAFNLVLHGMAALLFYRVAFVVFASRETTAEPPRAAWAAFFAAGLWAVHPLRAEPVAWATASPYPLTTVCLLLSFLFYWKAHQGGGTRPWLLGAWALAVAGYAAYPVAITYGLWLMAVDLWLLPATVSATPNAVARPGLNVRWLAKHAAFLAPAAIAVGFTLWTRFTAPGIFGAAPPVDVVDVWTRGRMALASLGYLAGRLFWPTDLTPNLAPFPLSETRSIGVLVLGGVAFGALFFAWGMRRKQPRFSLVGLGFAVIALPCLGWTERPSWPVDRYSYLPHLILVGGLIGGLVYGVRFTRGRGIAWGVAGAAALTVSGVFTRQQTLVWKDTDTLFTHLEHDPDFAKSPRQAGHVYILWAYHEGANSRLERAQEFFAKAQGVYSEAMRAAVARGEYAEALSLLTHWERYFPLTPILRREKGAWLLQLERAPEALTELRAAQRDLPEDSRLKSLLHDAEKPLGSAAAPR